jgi:diguanylate cyclase (GGDEF)-like protein/PAS domain S-box-containing protein
MPMTLVPPETEHAEFEARLRLELERRIAVTPAMLHSIDEQGRLISVSDTWLAKLGYTRDEVLGRRSSEFLTAESREHAVRNVLPEFFRTGRCENVEYQMVCKDGSIIDVLLSAVLDNDPLGHGRVSLAVMTDVTTLKQTKRQLAESEARYRGLADNSSDMVFQLDCDLVRRYVSPACRELLGYEPEELIGMKPVSMAHPDDAARLALVYQSLMNGTADRQSIINRIRHRNGKWLWVEARIRALKDPDTGRTVGLIGALRDISARKAVEDELAEANQRLRAIAGEDSLTGLANRRAFDNALAKEHRRSKRERTSLSLVMIDVDHFKAFNDRYGHPAGDDCLRQIGAALAQAIDRPGNVAARYGGEEFAVLLRDTDEAGAALMAERIRQLIMARQIRHEANPLGVVTISAGVAAFSAAECDGRPEMLVESADRALYFAKDSGRNAVGRASGTLLAPAFARSAVA